MRYSFAIGCLITCMAWSGCGAHLDEETWRIEEFATPAPDEELEPTRGPGRFGPRLSGDFLVTEQAFRELMAEPLLLSAAEVRPVFDALLMRYAGFVNALGADYLESTKRAGIPGDAKALTVLRQLQLSLRAGCMLVRLGTPAALQGDERAKYERLKTEHVLDWLSRSYQRHYVEDCGDYEETAAHVGAILHGLPKAADGLTAYCVNTEPYWLHPSPRDAETVLAEGCGDDDAALCFAWGVMGNGGDAAVDRACALGLEDACDWAPPSPDDTPADIGATCLSHC